MGFGDLVTHFSPNRSTDQPRLAWRSGGAVKLTNVRIENYKCIEDTEPFSVSPVTCLVGKNESGKSAILEALHKLNPADPNGVQFDDLMDYPRRKWSEYKEQATSNPANVLTTVWELEQGDVNALAEVLGPKALRAKHVTLRKGYDNILKWQVDLDEKEIVSFLLKQGKVTGTSAADFKQIESIQDLAEKLDQLPAENELRSAALEQLAKLSQRDAAATAGEILSARLPKLLYFTEYSRMPGQIAVDDLLQKQQQGTLSDNEKVFRALLSLVKTTPEELRDMSAFEPLIAELEAVSNRLTDEIFTYWSQNKHLDVDFRVDHARLGDPPPLNSGWIFRTRVHNRRHRVTVGFDERSSGFVWFFSFLIWFSQLRNNFGDNMVILLDEPGLSLHGKAQHDLLRYIEERLKPDYQVIYTTHSPFMVNPSDLLRSRTVEDVEEDGVVLGTKVGDKIFSTDADTVFPLQAALGYEITQSLFVGEHTLLVEGPSDLLYLRWFASQLAKAGRVSLDRRWVICPCEGIDKIGSFLALFGGNRLNIAVLTDYRRGIKAKVRSIQESRLLKDGHVFTAATYAGQDEADMEDVIGRAAYVELVNRAYGLGAKLAITAASLPAGPVVPEIEKRFQTMPPEVAEFDHFTPALFLLENSDAMRATLPDLDTSLERFEALFRDLNSLLPA